MKLRPVPKPTRRLVANKARPTFPKATRPFTLASFKAYASARHAAVNQMYGPYEYPYHLNRVDEVLVRFKWTQLAYRLVAWGHDLSEDTKLTRQQLMRLPLPMQSKLGIWACTDEPGATRKIRKHRTYPKIRQIFIGLVGKLADRIGNVEENIRTGNLKGFLKYKSEDPDMQAALRHSKDPRVEAMWQHLDWLFANGERLIAAVNRGEPLEGIPA